MKLTGKTAIVTGSGRGIGRGIAMKLSSEGASVVVNDLDPGPAKETVDLIEAQGGRALAVSGSVTERGFSDELVNAAVDSFGGLDILVNNAGYTWDSVIQKTSDEQWEAMIDIHLTAPFRLLRSAAPVFREAAKREAAEGHSVVRKVVNISSVAGTGGNVGQSGYSAGKAGVLGLTKTWPRNGAAPMSPSTRWPSGSSRPD
jgi:3-oxoacyl-[acyl-carrier protein] reductase